MNRQRNALFFIDPKLPYCTMRNKDRLSASSVQAVPCPVDKG